MAETLNTIYVVAFFPVQNQKQNKQEKNNFVMAKREKKL